MLSLVVSLMAFWLGGLAPPWSTFFSFFRFCHVLRIRLKVSPCIFLNYLSRDVHKSLLDAGFHVHNSSFFLRQRSALLLDSPQAHPGDPPALSFAKEGFRPFCREVTWVPRFFRCCGTLLPDPA